MNEASFIVGACAFAMACISAFAGFTAIALVIGLKNSTHSIQWKEVPTAPVEDPFQIEEEEAVLSQNPNKRMKLVEKEEFADLDNPEVISNEW